MISSSLPFQISSTSAIFPNCQMNGSNTTTPMVRHLDRLCSLIVTLSQSPPESHQGHQRRGLRGLQVHHQPVPRRLRAQGRRTGQDRRSRHGSLISSPFLSPCSSIRFSKGSTCKPVSHFPSIRLTLLRRRRSAHLARLLGLSNFRTPSFCWSIHVFASSFFALCSGARRALTPN